MELIVTVEIYPQYLHVTAAGQWVLTDILAFIEHVKEEADKAARRRILLDLRGIGGSSPSWPDRFAAGQHIATTLQGYTLAVIARVEVTDHSAEIVANNRGIKMAVKPSEEEALRWLLQPPASSSSTGTFSAEGSLRGEVVKSKARR